MKFLYLIICILIFTFAGCLVEKPKVGESFSNARVLFSHKGLESSCIQCHEKNRPETNSNTKHGNANDCVFCHSTDKWTGAINSTHIPLPTQCNSCHIQDRPNPDHYVKQDCFACHTTPIKNETPFDFTHRDAKLGKLVTCLPCHEKSRPTADHYPNQDCISCHDKTGTWKTNVPNPHPQNTNLSNCIQCHDKDRPKTVQYPSPGPNVQGHFEKNDCVLCHNPKTNGDTKFKFTHAANGHQQTSCLPCHEAKRPARHHESHDCFECHTSNTTWKTATSPHPGRNSELNSCISCHEAERPLKATYPGGQTADGHYKSKDCSTCHIPKTVLKSNFSFQHSNHSDSTIQFCLPCHYEKGYKKHKKDSEVSFEGDGNCFSCHTKHKSFKRK